MANERKLSWEYVAGFCDGEGYIGFRAYPKRKDGSRNYNPRLVITNTNLRVLSLIKEFLGCGNIYRHKGCHSRKNRTPANWKLCWIYQVTGKQNLLPILQGLQPYLVIKVEQADELIEYMKPMRSPTDSRKRLSDEEIAKRENHAQRIRILNRRGLEVNLN